MKKSRMSYYSIKSTSLQKLIWSVGKKMPFPYSCGLTFAKNYRKLMKSQWFSLNQFEELQCKKLRKIIYHAYTNVPYYHRVMRERDLKPEDIKTIKDVSKLPVLTKDDVRTHFDELQARNIHRYNPIPSHSSGSTGTPVRFYRTKFSSTMENAFAWRHFSWAGYHYGEKVALIKYLPEEILESVRNAPFVELLRDKGKTMILSAYHMKFDTLHMYAESLERFKPKLIRAFPSTAFILAQYLQSKNIDTIRPDAIITSSETLFPHQRKVIEDQFGCKVYNWYGCMENVVTAQECQKGGFHINPEYGLMELIDKDGMPVLDGKEGRIIGINFHNYAMPLIRYEMRDVGAPSSKTCSCGRQSPLVEAITGRVEDVIVTGDGRLVSRLDAAFRYSLGIKLTQLIQERKGHVLVKVVKDENYSKKDKEQLLIELRKRLGDQMDIEFEFVDDIPRTKAGKLRVIVSKVPIEFK